MIRAILGFACLSCLLLCGCGGESDQRRATSRQAESVQESELSHQDWAFLNADIEVQKAKMRMESPEEVWRLYRLGARREPAGWMVRHMAITRLDLIPILREVLGEPKSSYRDLADALNILMWVHVESYNIRDDRELWQLFLDAEKKVVDYYRYPPEEWSALIE